MTTPREGAEQITTTTTPDAIASDAEGLAGAGTEKAKERTYTEAEWAARETSRGNEVDTLRRQIVGLATRVGQEQEQATESAARSADQKAVDDGEITQAEATARGERRATEGRVRQDFEATKRELAQMRAEAYVVGKALYASHLAADLGIDEAVLIKDESLTNQREMLVRARELAMEKREAASKGTETYDKGPAGSRAGGSKRYVDLLKSGEELPSAAEIDRITAPYLNRR